MPGPYNLVVNFQPTTPDYLTSLKLKRLYISRKVNERYTVIWSFGTIEAVNKFSWNDDFEIFAMDRFTDGEKVIPNGTKKIWKGQVLTFNKDDSTRITKDVDPEVQDRIQIRNNMAPIWSGLSSALYTLSTAPPTSQPPKEDEPLQEPIPSQPSPPDHMTGIALNLLPRQEAGSGDTNKTDGNDTKDSQQSNTPLPTVADLLAPMGTMGLSEEPELEGATAKADKECTNSKTTNTEAPKDEQAKTSGENAETSTKATTAETDTEGTKKGESTNQKVSPPAVPTLTPKATPFFLARHGMISGAKSTLIPSSKVMVWIADVPVPPGPDQTGETFTQASNVAEFDVSAGVPTLINVLGVWSTGKLLDWEDGKFVPGTPLPKHTDPTKLDIPVSV